MGTTQQNPDPFEQRLRVLQTDLMLALETIEEGDIGAAASQIKGLIDCAPIDYTPNLLEACQYARDELWRALGGEDDAMNAARADQYCARIDAAIAKAKGRA